MHGKKLIANVYTLIIDFLCVNLQTEKKIINKYQREINAFRRIRLRP